MFLKIDNQVSEHLFKTFQFKSVGLGKIKSRGKFRNDTIIKKIFKISTSFETFEIKVSKIKISKIKKNPMPRSNTSDDRIFCLAYLTGEILFF